MFKYRDQLLVTLLLVGLLPAIFISYETLNHNSKEVKAFSLEVSQLKLQSIASGLATTFEEAGKYTALYARDARLQSMQYQQFMPFLKAELLHLEPNYEKFIIGRPNGEFFNTSGANLLQGGIRTFDDKSPDSKPKNIRKRDYWQATTLENKNAELVTYISNPMISFTTGVKQVVIASSIVDTQQQLVGMIGLSIGWARIDSLINELIQQQFSASQNPSKVMLVAHDGTYWYHWQQEKVIQIGKDAVGNILKNSDGENAVLKSNILDDPNASLSSIGKKMISGASGVELINVEGQQQYVIYLPIDGSQYSIGLVLEHDVILEPVFQALQHFIYILLISSVVIVLFGVLLARYFSKPIADLIDKIGLLSEGKNVDQISTTKTKELHVLSKAIFALYEKINFQSRKIQQSEERVQLISKSTNDGIWDWDLAGNTLYLSARWKEIIGYQGHELDSTIGTFQANIHPDDRQEINALFTQVIANDTPVQHCRFKMLHKDGSVLTILTRFACVRARDGQAQRIIGTNTNISDLVARENEVIELNKVLETKVKQRTEELEKAAIAAEGANKAKSIFLSNMSHEIRTPMNGIIGLTQLCLQTTLNEQQQDYLDKVMSSSNTLLKILNQILDFNKVEANMIELEKNPVNLRDLVTELGSLMQPAADEKGIALTIEVAAEIPEWVKIDALRLTQIMSNLCGNAIKFTERGGVTILVEPAKEGKQESVSNDEFRIRFQISDTGIGIKNQTALFTPFKQEDASTTRKFGGTGLGLAISKRLVELMGATLELESEFGKGSSFSFELRMQAAVVQQDAPEKARIDLDTGRYDFEGKSILIVEDNKVNQIVAMEMIKVTGCDIVIAEDGQEALDMLKERVFDVVLMDIQMPVMDGSTALINMRCNPDYDQIPVIAMTANVMTHEVESYLEAGFAGFIGKPYERDDMLRIINDILNDKA